MIKVLLDSGISLQGDRYPSSTHPLTLAARCDNIDAVRLILDQGVKARVVRRAYQKCVDPKMKRLLREKGSLQGREFGGSPLTKGPQLFF